MLKFYWFRLRWLYKHPKDGDCVGIYTCDCCGKRWVKDGKVHAEVW